MERKNSSEFQRFCGADIANLQNEKDPIKKVHLMRRINTQMYAEASKQDYDDFTMCQLLSQNFDDYIKESVPVHQAKLEEKMKKLNIKLKPTIRPTVDLNEMLKSKKCEGVCKNDELLEELDQFFNSMKKKPVRPPSTMKSSANIAPPNLSNDTSNDTIKMSIDDSSGDLVFETNFRRKKSIHQAQNANQQGASGGFLSSVFKNNRTAENRFNISRASSEPGPSTSTEHQEPDYQKINHNPYGYGGLKRKQEENGNNFFKKPTYLPRPEPQNDDQTPFEPKCDFKSATEELTIQYNKKHNMNNQNDTFSYNTHPNGGLRRSLGGRRTVNNKFVPPYGNNENNNRSNSNIASAGDFDPTAHGIDMSHPRLKNVDAKMIETISNEIMDQCDRVEWSSIAGLKYAKKVIEEAVVLPILRPDIFTGLRQPPRGVLLFGPPGTGKTLIGKCIASQSESTFFSISASSLTSKWIGEGEKMVRALFAVAAAVQPSVVFIDEVDSLLCQRSESEHESSRRLKTEFLVQLDGAGTAEKDRILIVGATNRPQELDEAARRRFVKRLYIPLPELTARREIMVNLLSSINHVITESHLEEIASRTDGYSGADMKVLCQEAVMGPVRSISFTDMRNVAVDSVRPVNFNDFLNALSCVRASVSPDDLQQYIDWNNTYGSGGGQ